MSVRRTLDALDDADLTALSAVERARSRAELMAAWLRIVIDANPNAEAVSELRGSAFIVPIIQKRRASDD